MTGRTYRLPHPNGGVGEWPDTKDVRRSSFHEKDYARSPQVRTEQPCRAHESASAVRIAAESYPASFPPDAVTRTPLIYGTEPVAPR
jgi:hypothetical protein